MPQQLQYSTPFPAGSHVEVLWDVLDNDSIEGQAWVALVVFDRTPDIVTVAFDNGDVTTIQMPDQDILYW